MAQQQTVNWVKWIVFSSDDIRKAEAKASSTTFLQGTREPLSEILNFRDRFFPSQFTEIKGFFERLKTEQAYDLVFIHHRHDLHEDHRLINELTWNTFREHLTLEY